MKKVLIITYYWPPAGGPGVQRVLKIVKYLAQFGWQPVILTVENPVSSAYDDTLKAGIPEACIVYKTKTAEPFSLYRKFMGKKSAVIPKDAISQKQKLSLKEKISRWIRANIFIPDARVGWVKYNEKEGLKIIEKEKPQIIFSTSPPHSLQIGAKRLANKSGLPWIADLRDPWLDAYWQIDLHNAVVRKLNGYLEKNTLKRASEITTVSEGLADLYAKRIGVDSHCIFNGFDKLNKETQVSYRFTILFIGNLSKYQSPEPLFSAVSMLSDGIKEDIDIVFIGKVFDDFYAMRNKFQGVNIIFREYMAFKDLESYARSVSLLLLIIHKISYTKDYMTAKIFDYLSFRKPVLALGEKGSAVDLLLKETGSGQLFEYEKSDEMADYISKVYRQWKTEKTIVLNEYEKLEIYSSKTNVEKLTKIFERLTH
ncbi:MAG: glycosyltransferase [Calditrichaceae bacterium]|nr:glycosyltransferase [Calditrichaceae bacterium]RQV93879.1 MAG: hypothetical protein EH224_11670 [Calditrichota bacterium]